MSDGSIYLLSRKVSGDSGEQYRQIVSVFARDPRAAEEVVRRDFKEIRQVSEGLKTPYLPEPAWDVQEITLDAEKIVTALITYETLAEHEH